MAQLAARPGGYQLGAMSTKPAFFSSINAMSSDTVASMAPLKKTVSVFDSHISYDGASRKLNVLLLCCGRQIAYLKSERQLGTPRRTT